MFARGEEEEWLEKKESQRISLIVSWSLGVEPLPGVLAMREASQAAFSRLKPAVDVRKKLGRVPTDVTALP